MDVDFKNSVRVRVREDRGGRRKEIGGRRESGDEEKRRNKTSKDSERFF